MPKRSVRWGLAVAISALVTLQAAADVRIILRDGRVINVPVAPEEVHSIEMRQGRTGAAPGLPPAPNGANLPPAPGFLPGSKIGPDNSTAVEPPRSGATFNAPAPVPAEVPAGGKIQVGPTRQVKLPSQAAGMAKSGDVIEIDEGSYRGDVATWKADGITIRGVGGRARLIADGNNAEGKAIWVTKGHDITIENVEFAGARVPDRNGAGIRAEGTNLKLINCFFHDNEEGILAGDNPNSVIDIENSEFARDGGNEGRSHELYVNHIKELIVRGSYFHQGHIGHLIKSRAATSLIVGNRITDENGDSSYQIDTSNGGRVFVIGNLFEQDQQAQNSNIVANAMEGATNNDQEFWVVNNTFVNDLGHGTFVVSRAPGRAKVINNLFIGGGVAFHGSGDLQNNVFAAGPGGAPNLEKDLFDSGDIKETGTKTASDPGLVNVPGYDWHPKADSPVIGAGIDPGTAGGMPLLPSVEYVHPAHGKPVRVKAPIDVGAYQHGS